MRRPPDRGQWHRRAVAVVIACGCASASGAIAADAPATVPLGTVEVVGTTPVTAAGVDRDRLPYTVQTGTAADARAMQADSLSSYLLRRFTGFNVADVQGNPLLPEVTFHGYRASSLVGAPQGISVFLDGVRVNEAFGDIVSWDLIPDAALARMTMVSGSNPAYGLNTLGGALVLTTQSGKSAPGAFADVRAGSFGLVRGDLTWGFGADAPVDGYVAATLFNQDGWREHSPAHLGNLYVKIGGDVHDDRWEVALLGGDSRTTGNALSPSTRYIGATRAPGLYDADRAEVYTWPDDTHNRAVQLSGRFSHRLAGGSEWTTVAYARGTHRDSVSGDVDETYAAYVAQCNAGFRADGAPVQPTCPYAREEGAALASAVLNTTSTRQATVGVSSTWTAQTEANHLAVGADLLGSKVTYRQSQRAGAFTPDRRAVALDGADSALVAGVDGRTRTAGVYLTDTWSVLASTFVTGSLRYTWSRVANTLVSPDADHGAETFTYEKLNPALGIARQFAGVTLFANGSQSNRVPTSIELGCADPLAPCRLPAGLQSDPFLAQVVARTLEVGARGVPWSGARYSVAYFDTRNRDDILFLRAPDTQNGYFANFPQTRNRGIDVALDQQLGPVALHAGYSYLDATYDASGSIVEGERTIEAAPGMRRPGLPRHALRASVDWQLAPTVMLGADAIANSRIVTAGNEDGLVADAGAGGALRTTDAGIGGWTVVNLRASWRPDPRFEVYGTLGNALGKRFETYGMLGDDLFPNGRLVEPHVDPRPGATARFVAPGSPTAFFVGVRYRMP